MICLLTQSGDTETGELADEKGRGTMFVTTTNDVTGYKITRYLGVVRGLTVRSRSVVGNIGASLQTLFGGNITLYTSSPNRRGRRPSTTMPACRHRSAPMR